MVKSITEFRGEYRFLSNFYEYGDPRTTAEHHYQAAKTVDPAWRSKILSAPTPGEAKKLGRRAPLRPGWENFKLEVMRVIVLDKFYNDLVLRNRLLATGDAELIEGNTWGDTFWGVCGGEGENWLGRILMLVRARCLIAAFNREVMW